MWFTSWPRRRTSNSAPWRKTRCRPAAPRFRPRLEQLEDRVVPSQIDLMVSSLADSGDNSNPGNGTLRAAILTADAGSHSDKYTISFDPNLFTTGAQTIDLHGALPDLSNNITIQGPGASSLTVNGAGVSASAIFVVDTGETAGPLEGGDVLTRSVA